MKKKFCPSCKDEKLIKEFHKNSSGGVRSYCKVCVREKRKEYREKNKKKVYAYNNVYNKTYRAKNKKP